MTKSKGVDPAVQAVSAIQNTMVILSNRVTARGGNLTEALVRLGKGETRYENSLNMIAGELAAISAVPPTEIVAPEGGRMYRVWVHEEIPWLKTIFPGAQVSGRKIILVNFGMGQSEDSVFLWSKERNLVPADLGAISALGEKKPRLCLKPNLNVLVIVLLQEGYPRFLWDDDGVRNTDLNVLERQEFLSHCYFAFEDPSIV